MYKHRPRRRRFRSKDRPFRRRNGGDNHLGTPSSFYNGQSRPYSFKGPQNIHKLIEKYSLLAKEALSSGDRVLSENYLQHVDHFSRIAGNNVNNKNDNLNNNDNLNKEESSVTNNKDASPEENSIKKIEEEQKK